MSGNHKRLVFPLYFSAYTPVLYEALNLRAKEVVYRYCPKGWAADGFYSFYADKGIWWAKTTRRKIEDEKENTTS